MSSTLPGQRLGHTVFPWRAFALTCLITSLWVNASEIFRYFVFVMPMMRSALSAVPGVAPMDLPVFLIWGVWDTLLVLVSVFFYWLYAQQFGAGLRSALIAGTASWTFFFLLFWLGMINMGLARMDLVAIALPLAWLECVVACWIAQKCFLHFSAAESNKAIGAR